MVHILAFRCQGGVLVVVFLTRCRYSVGDSIGDLSVVGLRRFGAYLTEAQPRYTQCAPAGTTFFTQCARAGTTFFDHPKKFNPEPLYLRKVNPKHVSPQYIERPNHVVDNIDNLVDDN